MVALSGSRRTESAWIKTRVFDKAGTMVATMLLNMATLKDPILHMRRSIGGCTEMLPAKKASLAAAHPLSKCTSQSRRTGNKQRLALGVSF